MALSRGCDEAWSTWETIRGYKKWEITWLARQLEAPLKISSIRHYSRSNLRHGLHSTHGKIIKSWLTWVTTASITVRDTKNTADDPMRIFLPIAPQQRACETKNENVKFLARQIETTHDAASSNSLKRRGMVTALRSSIQSGGFGRVVLLYEQRSNFEKRYVTHPLTHESWDLMQKTSAVENAVHTHTHDEEFMKLRTVAHFPPMS